MENQPSYHADLKRLKNLEELSNIEELTKDFTNSKYATTYRIDKINK